MNLMCISYIDNNLWMPQEIGILVLRLGGKYYAQGHDNKLRYKIRYIIDFEVIY